MKKILGKIIFAISLGAFSRLVGFAINPFIAPYLSELGFSESLISFMSSFGPFTVALLLPATGVISDRVGRKKMFVFGMVAQSISIFAIFMLKFYPLDSLAVLGLLLRSFSSYLTGLAILTLIQDYIKEERGSVTGVHQSISSLGMFLGPLLGSFVVFVSSVYSVLIFGFLSFIILALVGLFIKEGTSFSGEKISLRDCNPFKQIKLFLGNRRLRAMGIMGFGFHLSEPIFGVFIPLFALNTLGIEVSKVGFIVFALYALNITQFISGKMVDVIGSGKVVIFGTIIYAISVGALFFVNSFAMLFIISLSISLGSSIWNTSAWSYMYQEAQKEKCGGRISSSYAAIAASAQFLSYTLSGFLLLIIDIRQLFAIYACLVLLAILMSSRTLLSSDRIKVLDKSA